MTRGRPTSIVYRVLYGHAVTKINENEAKWTSLARGVLQRRGGARGVAGELGRGAGAAGAFVLVLEAHDV